MENVLTNDFLTFRGKQAYDKQLKLKEKIDNYQAEIKNAPTYHEKGVLREKLFKAKGEKNSLVKRTRRLIGIFKTDLEVVNQSVENSEKNYKKSESLHQRKADKFQTNLAEFRQAQANIKTYQKKQRYSDKLMLRKVKKWEKKLQHLNVKNDQIIQKINLVIQKIQKIDGEKSFLMKDTIDQIDADFKELFQEARKNQDQNEVEKLEKDYALLKKQSQKFLTKFDHQITKQNKVKSKLEAKSFNLEKSMNDNQQLMTDYEAKNHEAINRAQQYEKEFQLVETNKKVETELNAGQKLLNRYQKTWDKNLAYQTKIEKNINFLSDAIGIQTDLVAPAISVPTITFNLLETLFLKDWFFIILTSFLSAGVVLGTYLYIDYGVGAMNDIPIVLFLKKGLEGGDYSGALGFATGFMLARILEGPLVGILDIGGSILTGVGIGIPAVFLSVPSLAFMMHNPFYALIIGLVVGAAIGIIVMIVRWLKPKKMANFGTDVMIGAGNSIGKFLGPLVIISAVAFQPLVGIGAGLGAAAFMWMKKPIVGGAIIGAMLFGLIPAFV